MPRVTQPATCYGVRESVLRNLMDFESVELHSRVVFHDGEGFELLAHHLQEDMYSNSQNK
jgi:hypothetical protein